MKKTLCYAFAIVTFSMLFGAQMANAQAVFAGNGNVLVDAAVSNDKQVTQYTRTPGGLIQVRAKGWPIDTYHGPNSTANCPRALDENGMDIFDLVFSAFCGSSSPGEDVRTRAFLTKATITSYNAGVENQVLFSVPKGHERDSKIPREHQWTFSGLPIGEYSYDTDYSVTDRISNEFKSFLSPLMHGAGLLPNATTWVTFEKNSVHIRVYFSVSLWDGGDLSALKAMGKSSDTSDQSMKRPGDIPNRETALLLSLIGHNFRVHNGIHVTGLAGSFAGGDHELHVPVPPDPVLDDLLYKDWCNKGGLWAGMLNQTNPQATPTTFTLSDGTVITMEEMVKRYEDMVHQLQGATKGDQTSTQISVSFKSVEATFNGCKVWYIQTVQPLDLIIYGKVGVRSVTINPGDANDANTVVCDECAGFGVKVGDEIKYFLPNGMPTNKDGINANRKVKL